MWCLLCAVKEEAAPAGGQPALPVLGVKAGGGGLQGPELVSKPRPDLHSSNSSSSNQGEGGGARFVLYCQNGSCTELISCNWMTSRISSLP